MKRILSTLFLLLSASVVAKLATLKRTVKQTLPKYSVLIATSTVILALDVPSRRLKRSLLPRPAIKVTKLLRGTALTKGVARDPRAAAKAEARKAVVVLAKVARRAKCMR